MAANTRKRGKSDTLRRHISIGPPFSTRLSVHLPVRRLLTAASFPPPRGHKPPCLVISSHHSESTHYMFHRKVTNGGIFPSLELLRVTSSFIKQQQHLCAPAKRLPLKGSAGAGGCGTEMQSQLGCFVNHFETGRLYFRSPSSLGTLHFFAFGTENMNCFFKFRRAIYPRAGAHFWVFHLHKHVLVQGCAGGRN